MTKKFVRESAETKSRRDFTEALLDNVQLVIEDMNWRRAAETIFGAESDKFLHDGVLADSIDLFKRAPTYKQVIELNKAFVLGAEGFHRPILSNPFLQYCVDYILDNKENKRTFSGFRAQEKQIESKDLKGEIFYKIYINTKTGEIIIRVEKDTSKIIEVITQEGDSDYRLYYKYKQTQKKYDFDDPSKTKTREATIHIPDIMNDDIEDIKKRGAKNKDGSVVVFGYLATFGDAGFNDGRGWPVYMSIFSYLRAHKGVAEDSTTILKALSRFAWKKKYKGMSATQLAGIKSLAQTFNADGNLNNVPAATGSTLLENDTVTNEQVEIKHNGQAFWDTSRILIQQIASGAQKMEHYFGNPANANLATATSMELPMLKDFQKQQAEFSEVVETILTFCVLKTIEIKGAGYIVEKTKERDYDVPTDKTLLNEFMTELKAINWATLRLTIRMPEILDKEVAALILATINAFNSGLISDIDAASLIYALLGFHDVDNKISALFGDTHEPQTGSGDDAQAMNDKAKQLADAIKAKADKAAKGTGGDNVPVK